MTHTELVAEVAKDAKLPRKLVGRVLRSFVRVAVARLLSGSKVKLILFGTFYTVVPKKKPMFGGRRQPTGRAVIRFKESRWRSTTSN